MKSKYKITTLFLALFLLIGMLNGIAVYAFESDMIISSSYTVHMNVQEIQDDANQNTSIIMKTDVWNRTFHNAAARLVYTISYNQGTMAILSANPDNLTLTVSSPFTNYAGISRRQPTAVTISGVTASFRMHIDTRLVGTETWVIRDQSFTVSSLSLN